MRHPALAFAVPALAAALALGACGPKEYVYPVVAMPADARSSIAAGTVSVEFVGETVNRDKLARHIQRAVPEYVARCNPEGSVAHDFRVRVLGYDRGSGGAAYIKGDSSSTDIAVAIVPPGADEPISTYEFGLTIAGIGMPGVVGISNSEKYLAERLGERICEYVLDKPLPDKDEARRRAPQ